MDRIQHIVTKYLSGENTHAAMNSKFFKKLDHLKKALYEVELAKAQIEGNKSIIVEFFIPKYAKPRLLELYYNFYYQTFCCTQVRRVGNGH